MSISCGDDTFYVRDAGTNRERWEARRGDYRLEVYWDEENPDEAGWSGQMWLDAPEGPEVLEVEALDVTDPEDYRGAQAEAMRAFGWDFRTPKED